MKQKLLTLLLALMMLCNLIGCSLFTPFKLREETITMEYGEELSEDVSTYVTARNYDEVTYDYSNAYPDHDDFILGNNLGTATFTDPGKELTLNIEWVDTTAPAITNSEITIYGFYMMLGGVMADQFSISELLYEAGVNDALGGYVTSLSIDGVPLITENMVEEDMSDTNIGMYNRDDKINIFGGNIVYCEIGTFYTEPDSDPLFSFPRHEIDYGDHEVQFTLTDWAGNTSTHTITLHYVRGVSDEELEHYGLSEEDVTTMIEDEY